MPGTGPSEKLGAFTLTGESRHARDGSAPDPVCPPWLAAPPTEQTAAARMAAALRAPTGVSATGLAWLCERDLDWVGDHLDAGVHAGRVIRLAGFHAPQPAFQAVAAPPGTVAEMVAVLLAGAVCELACRGWYPHDLTDATGRALDMRAALLAAAGSHPFALPTDPLLVNAVFSAEDLLADHLAALVPTWRAAELPDRDPAHAGVADAGETLAVWQGRPGLTGDDVRGLLTGALDNALTTAVSFGATAWEGR